MARKLAAIVVIDAVNYSALVERDETATLSAFDNHYKDVIAPQARRYRGRVFKRTGDGVLLDFRSAVEAVSFAVAVQVAMPARNRAIPDDRRIQFRIGINIGDIVEEGSDLLGDGVNIASRLEGLAEPGGICLSGSVFDYVRSKLDIGFDHGGKQALKNIAEPIDIYTVVFDERTEAFAAEDNAALGRKPRSARKAIAAVSAAFVVTATVVLIWWYWNAGAPQGARLPRSADTSIVVLPYESVSDTRNERLFARGLTADLRSSLGALSNVLVIADRSARKFSDKTSNFKEIASALGVRYILTGTVEVSNERLRVSARLIDGATGTQRWAEQFTHQEKDIFKIRDEIVKTVLTEILAKLRYGDAARGMARGTRSLKAWLLALQGWEEGVKLNREGISRARELYRKALAADPNWAQAMGNLAWTYRETARRGWSESREADIAIGIELSKKAIATDPREPTGYFTLGNLYVDTGRYEEGIRLREKALQLAPNDLSAIVGLAWNLQWIGKLDRALALYERARKVSPDLPATYIAAEAFARHQAGQIDTAIKLYQSSLKKLNRLWTRPFLAAAYAESGRIAEAREQVGIILKEKPDAKVGTFMHIIKFRDPKRKQWLRDLWVKAGLPE